MRSELELYNCRNDPNGANFLIALNHNLSYPLQAHAQTNNIDNTISSYVTSDTANIVISEQPIVLRELSHPKILIM